jgi:hypothetical protein
VEKCISILELAQSELKAKNVHASANKLLESLIKDQPNYTEAIEDAKTALKIAEQQLAAVKKEVSDNATRRDIRWAIMEGYAIITLLREKVLGE